MISLKRFYNRINHYMIIDNIHKHPYVSELMCKLGRHDFEYSSTVYDDQGDPIGATLECFYCLRKRNSRKI
jgi:hypothetical protein